MIEQMGMSESTVQEYVVSMDDGKLEETFEKLENVWEMFDVYNR